MTTLRELIAKIDLNAEYNDWADKEMFSGALGLNCWGYDNIFDKAVKRYWLNSWVCTDTRVGTAAYFLNNELVAVSHQQARKSDCVVQFVSNEAANKMREFILSLEDNPQATLCNLDQEIICTAEAGYRTVLE